MPALTIKQCLRRTKVAAKKFRSSVTPHQFSQNGSALVGEIDKLIAAIKHLPQNKRIPLLRAEYGAIKKEILKLAVPNVVFTVDDVLLLCKFRAKTDRKIIGAVLHSMATKGKKPPLRILTEGKRGPKGQPPKFVRR